MCAKGRSGTATNSCGGDSGSGIVALSATGLETLVGAVSYGTNKCGGNRPSVYTNIFDHLDWINNVTTTRGRAATTTAGEK